ncbi:MAG TPA: DUF4249 domain-containing protein [Chitinophagaceae bacterium]|nr:DUF4249 domain-containing protein [Chitinophagaceae bacterium]
MQKNKLFLPALYCCLVISSACVKQVAVDTRYEKSKLVVEGAVTTDSVPYSIRLTYSGHVRVADRVPDSLLEKNANITIMDDAGNSTGFAYADSGVYRSTNPNFIGKSGRSYTINIELPGGKKYISVPEKMPQKVAVDALKVEYVQDFDGFHPTYLLVHMDATDPADQENYYKWNFLSWMPRKSNGIGCGFGCIEYEYCFQRNVDSFINIMSDASINGNKIENLLVGRSYIYWYGNHYIDVSQQSLTRAAYQFWQQYNDQQTRTGTTLDPLPGSIKGNVYNASNESDFALGYFSAEAVTHKLAVLVPFNITQFWLDLSAQKFIPPGPGICFEVFHNALPYPPSPARQYPPPAGWENAEVIEVHW